MEYHQIDFNPIACFRRVGNRVACNSRQEQDTCNKRQQFSKHLHLLLLMNFDFRNVRQVTAIQRACTTGCRIPLPLEVDHGLYPRHMPKPAPFIIYKYKHYWLNCTKEMPVPFFMFTRVNSQPQTLILQRGPGWLRLFDASLRGRWFPEETRGDGNWHGESAPSPQVKATLQSKGDVDFESKWKQEG